MNTIIIPDNLPENIAPNHYIEWKKSGISDEIIYLNFSSLFDQRAVDKILGRRTKRMWNRPEDLVPCWCASGVDPLTEESTWQGVQVKPNTPRINDDGKPVKYEGARDAEASPLFLNTGLPDFWPNIINDITKPIIITEGAKKAGALLSNGYNAISIPGVPTCRKKGRLHENLKLFTQVGRTIYLCFDNDILVKKPVQDALIALGGLLRNANGCNVKIIQLPEGEAKGADDFLVEYGKEEFDKLVENALTIQEWRDEIIESENDEDDKKINSKLARNFAIVNKRWGRDLRYNTLTKNIELNGKILEEDESRLNIALEFDIDISQTDCNTILRRIARDYAYSPVVEYLDEIAFKYQDADTSILDNLAFELFGTQEPLHQTYLKNFLVSAVARARDPGCKVDHVLMLVGPQGSYKSTFFRTLFGEDFFSDQLGTDIGDKDEKMKISQYWCLEWAEFEAVYKKKDVSQLKNFITNVEDTYRAPYAAKDKRHKRPCVFVGTSNEMEILKDPTGDRRFWIILLTLPKIAINKVRELKDRVWAAADKLYKSGYQYTLTDEQEKLRHESNKEFRQTSYWDEILEQTWIESGRPSFMSTETVVKALGFADAKEVKKFDMVEITASMLRLGFKKSKNGRRINGIQRRGWEIENCTENISQENSACVNVSGVSVLPNNDYSRHINDTPQNLDVSGVSIEKNEKIVFDTSDAPQNLDVSAVCQLEPLYSRTDTPPISDTSPNQENNNFENKLKNQDTGIQVIPPEANTELLRSLLGDPDCSWEMILELTEEWDDEYKKAVFYGLTPDEQNQYRAMKPKPTPKTVKAIAPEITFTPGDIIQPVSGRDKGKKFTVTSFTDGRVYGKPKAGMIKSFLPNEIVKV